MNYSPNYSMPEPGYGDLADIDAVNDAIEMIDHLTHGNRTMFAGGWEAEETYSKGKYVVKTNPTNLEADFYRCKEDNTTGAWDASKWEHKTIGEALEELATSAGAQELDDLSDVEITSPTEGQILRRNANGDWVNTNMPDTSVTKTAEGNPVEFTDGANAPLVECEVEFEAQQDLHGYDKPWVGGTGNNIWDEEWELGGFETDGSPNARRDVIRSKNYIPCLPSTSYFFVQGTLALNEWSYWVFYDSARGEVTTPSTAAYMKFQCQPNYGVTYNNDCAVNYPSTVTTYSPYSNICPISGYSEVGIDGYGKNLIPMTLESLKSYNTVGTWSGNSYQRNGVTFDVQTDVNNYVIGIKATGTASTSSTFVIVDNIVNPFGGMVLNGCPVSGSASAYEIRFIYKDQNDGWLGQAYDFGDGVTIGNGYPHCSIVIDVLSGYAIPTGGLVFRPMVRLASDADATFKPYIPNNYTISLGSTRYGGTLDVVRGVLMVTHEKVSNSTAWYLSSTTGFTLPVQSNDRVGCISSHYERYIGGWNDMPNFRFQIYNNTLGVKDNRFSTVEEWKQYITDSGVEFVFAMANPIEVQLTPTEVKSLLGNNTIYTDGKTLSIEYITSKYSPITEVASRQISAVEKLLELIITANREKEMKATQNYTAGDLLIVSGKLYKASSNIANGSTLVINSNVTSTTIAAELAALA